MVANGGDGPNNTRIDAGNAYIVLGSTSLFGNRDFAVPGTANVVVYGARSQDQIGSPIESAASALLKRELFANLDKATPAGAVIASSTSEIPPSEFMTGHKGSARMVVAHPLNPPHLVPAVELCPSPETAPETVKRAKEFMAACGQAPLIMTSERKGFVMNRLQIALVREAWHLVAQGVCSPQDVDIAVRDGLAHRWSVIGPFETFQLTTRKGYAQMLTTYAETLANIADDLDSGFPFDKAFGEKLDTAMSGPLSSDAYDAKMARRDAGLLQRLTLRKR